MKTNVERHGVFLRILLDGVLVVAAIFGPWAVLCAVAIVLALFFGGYEVLVAGFVFDARHASGGDALFGVEFPMTAFLLIVCAVALLVRRRLAPRTSVRTLS